MISQYFGVTREIWGFQRVFKTFLFISGNLTMSFKIENNISNRDTIIWDSTLKHCASRHFLNLHYFFVSYIVPETRQKLYFCRHLDFFFFHGRCLLFEHCRNFIYVFFTEACSIVGHKHVIFSSWALYQMSCKSSEISALKKLHLFKRQHARIF